MGPLLERHFCQLQCRDTGAALLALHLTHPLMYGANLTMMLPQLQIPRWPAAVLQRAVLASLALGKAGWSPWRASTPISTPESPCLSCNPRQLGESEQTREQSHICRVDALPSNHQATRLACCEATLLLSWDSTLDSLRVRGEWQPSLAHWWLCPCSPKPAPSAPLLWFQG